MSGAPRPIRTLLAETIALYRAQLRLLLALAGTVVAIVELIVGVGLGELTARYQSNPSKVADAITLAASTLVTVPLVSAMLARAVLDVRGGREPSMRRSASFGLDLFAPVLGAVILYAAGVVAGIVAFVVPGVIVFVSWYFVAQAVVVDGRRGSAALSRSAELVRGHWLHSLRTGITVNALVAVPGFLVASLFDTAARAAGAEALVVLGEIAYGAFALPFVSVAATLYYLDLRG